MVEADATSCISKSDASEILKQIRTVLQDRSPRSEDYVHLYQNGIRFDTDTEDLPSGAVIGKWIRSNDGQLFASPTYEESLSGRVQELKERMYILQQLGARVPGTYANVMVDSLINTLPSVYPHTHIGRQRPAIDGFFSSAGLEFDVCRITARSQYSNLPEFEIVFVFLWSRRSLFCFEYKAQLIEDGWEERSSPERVKWSYEEFANPEGEVVASQLETKVTDFEEFVLNIVKKQFHVDDVKI